jgi:hypothetical protein
MPIDIIITSLLCYYIIHILLSETIRHLDRLYRTCYSTITELLHSMTVLLMYRQTMNNIKLMSQLVFATSDRVVFKLLFRRVSQMWYAGSHPWGSLAPAMSSSVLSPTGSFGRTAASGSSVVVFGGVVGCPSSSSF